MTKYDDDLIISLKQSGRTWTEIADELGVEPEAVRSYSRNQDWYGVIKDHSQGSTSEVIGDGEYTGENLKQVEDRDTGSITSNLTKLFTDETQIESLTDDDLLLMHKLDPDVFKIRSLTSNVYTMNGANGTRAYNFQSKIITEPKSGELTDQDLVEVFANAVEPYVVNPIKHGLNNLVIPLADLHFGITTMDDENVTEKLDRIVDIIEKGYKTIVIEQLGDLFHSSQLKSSQTLRGTYLEDVDTIRALEDAKTFYDVIIESALRNSKTVRVEHAAGNHSGNMEYMFLMYLEAKYPQLEVNRHNAPRTAFLLDRVGILITHGHLAKNKLNSLFTTNYKEIWATAETAEIHTGHFHTKEMDHDGIIHRQMGTFKRNDAYEIDNGWTMNKKIIQLIEYNETRSVAIYEV